MISEVKLGLITDPIIREAITSLYEDLRNIALLKAEFKHVEITFDAAVTDFKFYHGFSFIPTHVITGFVTNNANVIWDLDESTKDYILLTTSDACTVRAFLGRYEEGERA